jgi:uncharacterized protein YcbK (DUF882 family)
MIFPDLKFFKPGEFSCGCGCGENNMQPTFLWKLEQARELACIPFSINSGFRCQDHNEKVGGKPSSDHISGRGVDIKATTGREKFLIVNAGLNAGITRIGVGKNFIHLGDGHNNPKLVLWIY